MKKLYILALALFGTVAAHSQVVISQVYGGGSNSGSTYSHDFVELFNRGSQPVTLTGHTLQYASATNTFNPENIQTLPTITIQPGKYYLIQQGKNEDNTADTPLPSPDFIPTVADNGVVLAIGASGGKIALVSNSTPITSASGSGIVDFVGFGATGSGTPANLFEGSGPAPAPSNILSIMRVGDGCQDTNNNANDFITGNAMPRNGATAANVCELSVKDNAISGLKMFPNPLTGSVLNITSNNNDVKTVAIFDVLGKQVINTKTTTGAVNVANLSSGVYMVKITEAGKTSTRKLVVK